MPPAFRKAANGSLIRPDAFREAHPSRRGRNFLACGFLLLAPATLVAEFHRRDKSHFPKACRSRGCFLFRSRREGRKQEQPLPCQAGPAIRRFAEPTHRWVTEAAVPVPQVEYVLVLLLTGAELEQAIVQPRDCLRGTRRPPAS